MTDNGPPAWVRELLLQVENQVVFGDTKAGQLVATDALLLTALALLSDKLRADVWPMTRWLGIVAAMLVGLSLLLVLVALAPSQNVLGRRSENRVDRRLWRMALRQGNRHEPARGGVVQFARIADAASPTDYRAQARAASTSQIEDDVLDAIWGKARWARHKFRLLDKGVKLTISAVVTSLAAGLLEAIHQMR